MLCKTDTPYARSLSGITLSTTLIYTDIIKLIYIMWAFLLQMQT